MKKMMMAVLFSLSIALPLLAGGVYSKTEFYNDVSVGSWGAVTNLGTTYATGGTYTAGGYTNYWRVNGTNVRGRLPLSGTYTSVWQGTTSASNAQVLTWSPRDGVSAYIVEKSINNSTWTNWAVVSPLVTTYTDRGTNAWLTSDFMSAHSAIPAIATPWDAQAQIAAASLEPMGLGWGSDLSFSFNDASTTLTVTAASPWTYWHKGHLSVVMGNMSTQLTGTVGSHFLYFDNSLGLLREAMTPWNFTNDVQLATVYWDGTRGLIGKETHEMTMDWATHEYLHDTIRTRYETGLTGTFSASAMAMTAGIIHDEDLKHSIPATNACVAFYHTNGVMRISALQATPFAASSGVIVYDNLTTTNQVAAGQYVASWVFAGNSPLSPIMVVVGQRVDSSLANARANNTIDSLALGDLPSQEMKILYRIIYHRQSGVGTLLYDETLDLRAVSLVPSSTFIPTAHSSLSGLSNDDHTQYALVAGGRPSAEATNAQERVGVIEDWTNSVVTTNGLAGTTNAWTPTGWVDIAALLGGSAFLPLAGGTMTGNIDMPATYTFGHGTPGISGSGGINATPNDSQYWFDGKYFGFLRGSAFPLMTPPMDGVFAMLYDTDLYYYVPGEVLWLPLVSNGVLFSGGHQVVTGGQASGAATVAFSNGNIHVYSPSYAQDAININKLNYRLGQDERSFGELALVIDAQFATPPYQFAQADYFTDQELYDAVNSSNVTYNAGGDYYTLNAGTAGASDTAVLTNGMLIQFKMNESNATALIENTVGDSHTGTAWAASSAFSVPGKVLTGFTFSDDSIIVDDPEGLGDVLLIYNSITIACWIKTTANDKYLCGGVNVAQDSERLSFGVGPGSANKLAWFNGTAWKNGSTSVNDGTWKHVAITLTNTTYTFYVNGVADGTGSCDAQTALGSSFRVGTSWAPATGYIGDMDDFRIYNKALASNEVFSIYNEGNAYATANGLLLQYKMNDSNATTVVANSGSATEQGTAAANTSAKSVVAKIDKGLNFVAASSDTITTPAIAALTGASAKSVAIWVKPTAAMSGDYQLIGCGGETYGGGSLAFQMIIQAGANLYAHTGAAADFLFAGAFTNGVWKHAAMTYAGGASGAVRLYVDGVMVAENTQTLDTEVGAIEINNPFPTIVSQYLNCNMDDARVYTRELSPAEVAAIYNEGLGRETDNSFNEQLVAQYKMNDSNATIVVEDSIGDLDGTAAANTSTLATSGKILTALNIDGNGATPIHVAPSAVFNKVADWTWSTWVYIDRAAYPTYGDGLLSNNGNSEGHGFLVNGSYDANEGKLAYYNAGGGFAGYSTGTVALRTWTHVAFSCTDATLTFFINGVASGTVASPAPVPSATDFVMGHLFNFKPESNWGLLGKLDDVRIYSRALSAVEVAALYNGGHGTEYTAEIASSPVGKIQALPLITATNCASGSLQILADTAGYDAASYVVGSDITADVSADEGTTWTNVVMAYNQRWADTNQVSFFGSFDFPVVGSQLVYRVNMSNACPAKIKGSIIWGVPE